MMQHVGIGYDIHRLVSGRKLLLGGIEIPYVHGLLGHSDADVLLHAICDSLLGAIGEGDIGEHFPDTEPKYHNISSIELLSIVADSVAKKGFTVSNIDTVVIAEEPNITPFKKQMQEKIAQVLNIAKERVSIKAKTNEGLGVVGKKEAIASYAVAMLAREG
jgi:2-C-methyl-D-erythritol 2,4-cyclodiphosphate synthase